MTTTVYYKSPEDQSQAIACDWGINDSGEWQETYRPATEEDKKESKDQIFAWFQGYAVATPTWDQLKARLK